MKIINSKIDLRQYVDSKLEGFEFELYGYQDLNEMVAAYAEELLEIIKEEGFEWGDDLENFQITDREERFILRIIDQSEAI